MSKINNISSRIDDLAEALQDLMHATHPKIELSHRIGFYQRGLTEPRSGTLHLNILHDRYAAYVTIGTGSGSLPITDLDRIIVEATPALNRWLEADTHASAIHTR